MHLNVGVNPLKSSPVSHETAMIDRNHSNMRTR